MEWISPEQGNILSEFEGIEIKEKIVIDGSNNYEIIKVSGNFPNGISLIKNNEGYFLEGTLGLVSETSTYYFTLQAKDLDTNETIQRWFSIEVKTKITEWGENISFPEDLTEKIYFSYQFELINPEGNETFIKTYGSLPNGVSLSETGLLYGVPEESSDDNYTFKISVYRNDEKICESGLLSTKVNSLSTIGKPIWVTDAGIIGYINYNDDVDLSILAYDYNGNDVKYKVEINNLPSGLEFDEETGKISGKCKTMKTQIWSLSVIPYINIDDPESYGEERLFEIKTNNIGEDDEITWEEQELKDAKIGYRYNDNVKAKSNNKIIYQIVNSELPKGLKMNKNGEIYGTVDLQEVKDYSFTIKASNAITFSLKNFTISVKKGLSKNSLDTFLYINKENQEEYQNMLTGYDRTSAYNILNDEYRIPSSPKIDIATICAYDPVLLKYKFNQFNLPIEIYWKETKKKSLTNYDFFYKSFLEGNKKTETFGNNINKNKINYVCADIKIHNYVYNNTDDLIGYASFNEIDGSFFAYDFDNEKIGYIKEFIKNDDERIYKVFDMYSNEEIGYVKNIETIYENDDGSKEKRGYIRNPIDENDIKIEYHYLGSDKNPESEDYGDEIFDTENIHQEVTEERTNYYYSDPNDPEEEFLIHDPIYKPQRDIYDYVSYGRLYVGDDENKKYITPVYKDMYYIIDTKELIHHNEEIYIKTITGDANEKIIVKYIIRYVKDDDNNIVRKEFIVNSLSEDGYASYDPFNPKTPQIVLDKSEYEIIKKENNINNYYEFDSKIISYKNASINGLRDVLSQSFNVEKFDDSDTYSLSENIPFNEEEKDRIKQKYNNILWYKIGNQEIVYNKNGDPQKFEFQHYVLKYDDERKAYYVKFEGEKEYLYVWTKLPDEDDYKQVFSDENGECPVIQKFGIINDEDNLIYKCYCVYPENSNIPFINCLFEIENTDIYLTCEYDEEKGIYEWFRIKQSKSPYVYYAKDNTDYGYDKDIVLPYIIEENIVDGKVTFLNVEEEKELLPEYMEGIYQPTLPLYYAIPNSQNTRLKNINEYERKGNYWYGRKFIFYELHFSPKFNENNELEKNIDNFTIPFYNDVNENSPEFLLI